MASKANKTVATLQSVDDFLAAVTPEGRRDDALVVCEMMRKIAGEEPRMWGSSMVGFGVRQYQYDSGHGGEIFRIGFAPRKPALVLYGLQPLGEARVLAIGKVTMGKGCAYIKRLKDVDTAALAALLEDFWAR
jgi:hypothetical protein